MALSNEIVLRPRFNLELNKNYDTILNSFEESKCKEFIIKCVGEHIFIKIPKEEEHFWSPQLHIEIDEIDEFTSKLHGFFGPKPTVWTFFMFLHFSIGAIFIFSAIGAYSNWSLNDSYTQHVSVMSLMLFFWFTLYFAGRIGRMRAKEQMRKLYNFMEDILIKS